MDRTAAVWKMVQGNPPQAENLASEILCSIYYILASAETTGATSVADTTRTSPKTGDANMVFPVMVMILSAAGIAFMGRKKHMS